MVENHKDLLTSAKEYSQVQIRCLGLLVVYLIVDIFTNYTFGSADFIRGSILCGILLIDQILRPFDYFKSVKVIMAIRYITICILAVYIGWGSLHTYEYVIYSLLYYAAAMQFLLFFDSTDVWSIFLHNVVVIIPVVLSGIIYIMISYNYKYLSMLVIICVTLSISISALSKYLCKQSNSYLKSLFSKERMIEKAMDINKNNMEKQEKLYFVNEQLGIKRIELEEANRKNKMVNEEIVLQNDIFKFYASSTDIVEYTNYLSKRLVDDMGAKCAGIMKIFESDAISVYEDYKKTNSDYIIDSKYRILGDANDVICEALYREFMTPQFLSDILGNELLICGNIRRLGYNYLSDNGINSFALKIIHVDGRRACVYIACHSEPNFFDDKKTFFDNLFYQLQVAMNNGFLYSMFEIRSMHDGLTGLYNRRTFNKAIEKYRHPDKIVLAERIAAIMIDIDNFKKVNDRYGHVFGDVTLVELASIIQKVIKPYDGKAYRYGGEEFIVLFYDKPYDEVVSVANDILLSVRSATISYEDISINATVSIGVCAYPDKCDNQLDVVDMADKALYISKTTGKNRVTA